MLPAGLKIQRARTALLLRTRNVNWRSSLRFFERSVSVEGGGGVYSALLPCRAARLGTGASCSDDRQATVRATRWFLQPAERDVLLSFQSYTEVCHVGDFSENFEIQIFHYSNLSFQPILGSTMSDRKSYRWEYFAEFREYLQLQF